MSDNLKKKSKFLSLGSGSNLFFAFWIIASIILLYATSIIGGPNASFFLLVWSLNYTLPVYVMGILSFIILIFKIPIDLIKSQKEPVEKLPETDPRAFEVGGVTDAEIRETEYQLSVSQKVQDDTKTTSILGTKFTVLVLLIPQLFGAFSIFQIITGQTRSYGYLFYNSRGLVILTIVISVFQFIGARKYYIKYANTTSDRALAMFALIISIALFIIGLITIASRSMY